MSWFPNDLVSDADLQDYESQILKAFGQQTFLARRTKALEDWLFPILKSRGFDPYQLRTRYDADAVFGFTGGVYADITPAATDTAEDDIDLAAVLATPSTDALYLGSTAPFRGVFFRLLDHVSSATGTLSVAYWSGGWQGLTIADGTIKTGAKTLSGGGSVTWVLPSDWTVRTLNTSKAFYWVRVQASAVPTGATATQLTCIRGSALRAPATLRTLALIMREAPTGADGPWTQKAAYYETEADAALQRALLIIGGEFDTTDQDALPTDAIAATAVPAGTDGWRMERC